MSTNDWSSVLIPMIRQAMPALVAQEIVGVQPMTDVLVDRPKYRRIDQTVDRLPKPPEGYLTVDVTGEVAMWIEEQPIHMWKPGDGPAYSFAMERYTVSEQLFTLLVLKWS